MSWFTQLFKRRELYDDISEEIEQHLAERTDELAESGLSPKDAAAQAAASSATSQD